MAVLIVKFPMRLGILKLIVFVLLWFGNTNLLYSQTVDKQTVLAVLSLNIARFTTWPADFVKQQSIDLNLCVIGDNVIHESFSTLTHRAVKNQKIRVINLSRLRNLSQCQLLYVSQLDRNLLIHILSEIKRQPILTIGENIEFLTAGGMFALVDREGKIELHINFNNIKQSGLIVSSRLLSLATIQDQSALKNYKNNTHD